MRFARSLGVVAALLGLLSACAPLNASTAIREAETHMDQARRQNADTYAPYEYYSALAYLTKAKKTEGYSEFGIAEQYGVKAKELAIKALAQARDNRMKQKLLKERTQTPGAQP